MTKSSILQIDRPINNKEFFVNFVIIFIFQAVSMAIDYITYFCLEKIYIPLVILVTIISLLPFIYLHFVNCTKRVWNIWGLKKSTSILLTFILFVLLGFSIYLFPIFIVLLLVVLMFLPEKRHD